LEEALDLSYDRLLMMMMTHTHTHIHTHTHTRRYVQGSPVEIKAPKMVPGHLQYDRPAVCVIAQQYSSQRKIRSLRFLKMLSFHLFYFLNCVIIKLPTFKLCRDLCIERGKILSTL
jgi:hypothetical protein